MNKTPPVSRYCHNATTTTMETLSSLVLASLPFASWIVFLHLLGKNHPVWWTVRLPWMDWTLGQLDTLAYSLPALHPVAQHCHKLAWQHRMEGKNAQFFLLSHSFHSPNVAFFHSQTFSIHYPTLVPSKLKCWEDSMMTKTTYTIYGILFSCVLIIKMPISLKWKMTTDICVIDAIVTIYALFTS